MRTSRLPRRSRLTALVASSAVLAGGLMAGLAAPNASAAGDPVLCFSSDVHAGAGGSQAAFATYLKSLSCTRIVMPGDLTNNGYVSQYQIFNTWYGSVKSKILPSRGNHDALAPLANYTGYWGSRVTTGGKPWYAVNIGAWHVISLDLTGGAATASELTWLKSDLNANAGKPTLAFWHVPRYATRAYTDNAASETLWAALSAHGADVVVNGHVHIAQRFAVTRGIREFIDSASGSNLHDGTQTSAIQRQWVVPGPQFGVLRLTLHAHGYDWVFTNTQGQVLDSGSAGV